MPKYRLFQIHSVKKTNKADNSCFEIQISSRFVDCVFDFIRRFIQKTKTASICRKRPLQAVIKGFYDKLNYISSKLTSVYFAVPLVDGAAVSTEVDSFS